MLVAMVVFWGAWGLIVYTYALYPLLLAVLGRLRSAETEAAPPDATSELPRVAMVVAAFNEARILPRKLANTWSIDYPADRFQLFVGSDGSPDASAEVLNACEDPRLRAFCFAERRGKISVLNDLMAQVDADIVVMSDANTMFEPRSVRRLVAHFADPKVGCVSGELLLEQDGGVSGEGLYWRYEGFLKRQESRLGFLIGCNGGIFALRRGLYEPLPASTIVEDFVLSMRVLERGYQVKLEPEARATEPPCPTARAEMTRKVRIGAGNFQALGLTRNLLHPRYGLPCLGFWSHKVLRWMVPQLVLVGLVANLFLVRTPAYSAILAAQLLGLAVAAWASHKPEGQRPPRWTRPISYFYLMNYALLCGFFRYLFRTQRVTWDRAAR
ncbi:MAG TPA: glycosyltransferase family 2 protein [Armatimonadota bacterium]|jgi:cellulose synthase/poly-beta-1,6-N-acetylglucosamine synthase-like glycosyltransferase